jgi:hypothetical protein
MPRSCGLTLRTLRTQSELETETLTERLRPYTQRFRPRKTKFSKDTITKAEHSQQTLYYVLDAYAKWSGYPVGFIYLFARVSAELRDLNLAAAKSIAASLRALADFIDKHAHEDVLRKLQPTVIANGHVQRPVEAMSAIAYDTVVRYEQLLPQQHPENEGRRGSERMKYSDSQQFVDDARQVRILLEIMRAVTPPIVRTTTSDDQEPLR